MIVEERTLRTLGVAKRDSKARVRDAIGHAHRRACVVENRPMRNTIPTLSLGFLLSAVACSSEEGSVSDASVSDAASDAAPEVTTDAGADVGSPVGCTQAELDAPTADFTKFPGVDISFFGSSPAQYTNHCAKTKVGDTVTFASDFTIHPLFPSGGNTPTFIVATNKGTSVEFVPTTAGVYGYECAAHPGVMFGAIKVVAK